MKFSSADDSTKMVFVGGGLSSLIMAKVLIRKGISARDITIVENSNELGGQYSSIRTDNSVFDLGMHIYYETGIEEIDSCFIDIQPENWIYLADNKKDIAGIFWKGNLQINSPYPDLRKKRFLKIIVFISILVNFINRKNVGNCKNAAEYLKRYFGRIPAVLIFSPILRKLYGCEPDSLDQSALKLVALNRVVLFNERLTRNLMKSDYLRSRIAFPEQLKLPNIRRDYGRGIYPEKFGFDRVIGRLAKSLTEVGVNIYTNSEVVDIELSSFSNKVQRISLKYPDGEMRHIENNLQIFWMTVPLRIPTKIQETLQLQPVKFYNKIRKVFVNVQLLRNPQSDILYYFYVFDPKSNIFRVTNYSAYVPDATTSNEGKVPVTVEYWTQENFSNEEIAAVVEQDLLSMGFCTSEDIVSINIPNRKNDFPTPDITSLSALRLRYHILNNLANNIAFCGAFSNNDNFFLHENLKHAFFVIKEKMNFENI